jgi:hypothetical protein
MRAFFAKLFAPLHIDQRRDRIGKVRFRIVERGRALRFDEDRPARAETAQRIVEPRRGGDQLGWRGGIEIGSAKTRGALKAAVLVENDARPDQRGPGQEVGEARRRSDIRASSSWLHPCRVAEVAAGHVDELGSRRAAQTESAWPIAQIARPAIQRRRPSPIAPASVPLTMASERGAPPSNIGSVSARWTGAK